MLSSRYVLLAVIFFVYVSVWLLSSYPSLWYSTAVPIVPGAIGEERPNEHHSHEHHTQNTHKPEEKPIQIDPTTKPPHGTQQPAPTLQPHKQPTTPFDDYDSSNETSSNSSSSSSVELVDQRFAKRTVVPIGVITHRPNLLIRLFEYMRNTTDRIDMKHVYVVEDGTSDETTKILDKYHATRVMCDGQVRGLAGLNQNYRCLMKYMHEKTDFDSFIFLEEDLMLSPDFYSYFLQLTPVLQHDPTVFCISTWSDNGFLLYAQDPSIIVRQEHFGGYGWAISRAFYEREIMNSHWGPSTERMWDQYMQDLTLDRVCLAPEIARTHHSSGNTGATINQVQQTSSFDNIKLSDVAEVDLHAESLVSDAFDKLMHRLLAPGIFVTCKGGLLDYTNSTLIVYFVSTGSNDLVWDRMASWFGMWGRGNGGAQRGISRGIVTLNYATNRVFLVGSASPIVKQTDKFKGVEPIPSINMASSNFVGFGTHDCRKKPPFVPPTMKVVPGDKGSSCSEVCAKINRVCELQYLPHLNQCPTLQEHTGCTSCEHLEAGNPSFALPSVREDGDKKTCMYSYHEKWLNCDGIPASNVYRLCPCV